MYMHICVYVISLILLYLPFLTLTLIWIGIYLNKHVTMIELTHTVVLLQHDD